MSLAEMQEINKSLTTLGDYFLTTFPTETEKKQTKY